MRVSRLATESLAAVVLLLASPAQAQSAWTIPGIVNAGGLNNTRFVSDFTATNPGTAAAQVTIDFFPSSTPNPKSVMLSPGQTIVYRNIVDSLFGTSGAGALSVSSAQPLLLRARTYNTASGGTYGVALPVYPSDRLMAPGDRADSLWISQDASRGSGYRTNIAVVFPDQTGGSATVTVFDADGKELGRKNYFLDAAGFQQFSVGSFAGAVSVGRAQIHVTRGRAAGYGVVVDNVTGDSSLFTFEDLPGGIQDVLVNGVARANGRSGAFFRTDGRFYNPTDTDATITVSFHASGNGNPSPATASFTLRAGKIRDVVDVLDALLALPVGSAGALHFQSDWPVAILCRTSNVDPTGANPGTFGAQQKPVPILSFLTSADPGAAITGIRQDAAFRTNVGFAAGWDGAQYTLTLATATGATVATTTASLGAWGWTQPNVQDLFPGTSIPADATLRIKVTEGSLDVYDSSIDNASGDPVVTPIAALPATIPSSATIGPQGGSIRSSDGRLTLRVPAGALSQATSLSFQNATNDAPQGTGPGYQLFPSGITFARSALLTLAYGRSEVEGSSAEALTITRRTAGGWAILRGGSIDPARHTLTVPLRSSVSGATFSDPRSRAPAATGLDDLAVARSWELVPSGRWGVFTGSQKRFSVYSVGESSSILRYLFDPNEPLLSNSPLEVAADWYANRFLYGDEENGFIGLLQGSLSVIYKAPDCPPPFNPVEIEATIINRSGFRMAYRPSGRIQVRVLPRKWKFEFTVDTRFDCRSRRVGGGTPSNFSDHLGWDVTVSFTLDDEFRVVENTLESLTARHGTPTYCGPYPDCGADPVIREGSPPFLAVPNVSGLWDRDSDTFGLRIIIAGFGPGDYRVHCTGDTYAQTTGNYAHFGYSSIHTLLPGRSVPFRASPDGFDNEVEDSTTITGTLYYECP